MGKSTTLATFAAGQQLQRIRPIKPSYLSRPESAISAALETAERSARE